jgi:hypothetical protein
VAKITGLEIHRGSRVSLPPLFATGACAFVEPQAALESYRPYFESRTDAIGGTVPIFPASTPAAS